MGCNQSTEKDVHESRQRVSSNARGSGANQNINVPTPVQNIAGRGQAYNEAVESPLGVSYTDERTGEMDYFRDIITKTAETFIDVSQGNAPLEGPEAIERAGEYESVLRSSKLDKKANRLFDLPILSTKICVVSDNDNGLNGPNSATTPGSSVETSPVKKSQNIVTQLLRQPTSISQADKKYLEDMCTAVSKGIEMNCLEDVGSFIAVFPELKDGQTA
eukprot:Nk52_evm3s304 gene=Nk52_evmTU3s304